MSTDSLQRTHHTISRAAEYFDRRQLQTQTGQQWTNFASVVLKELLDNALDAAETAGVAPEIEIEVDWHGEDLTITVSDNGLGLPADVLTSILDFDSRTSDKRAYRSPTRGAQGNALKTVVGIPTALGGDAPIVIDAADYRHTIKPAVDAAGNVNAGHTTEAIPLVTGTKVTVTIPALRQDIDPARWARAFVLANPHASVKISSSSDHDRRDNHAQFEDGPSTDFADFYTSGVVEVGKWMPTMPVPPHWFDPAAFQVLVDAESAGNDQKLVSDFVRSFRGLRSNLKVRAVCDAVPHAKRLGDLNGDAATLLRAMQSEARDVKPNVLGWVGEAHIRACFDSWYGIARDRFWYKRITSVDSDGLPFVVEAAIAETDQPADDVTAINYSPTFGEPMGRTTIIAGKADPGSGIRGYLSNCHATGTNVASFVHVIHPALSFLDFGKSTIATPPALRESVGESLWCVAKTLYTERERRRKNAAKAYRREQAAIRAYERRTNWTVKDAAFEVMEQAWSQATGNGSLPTSARSVFYQARPLIAAFTEKEVKDDYFTQTLLPDYQREVKELRGIYYEPRGALHEPHTKREVPLGTRDVDGYAIPDWTFDKILFVEKQGLWPVLQAANLAERYDMAVIASQGFSTVACRNLLAQAQQDCRIFVLHDADHAGYNIALTLAEATARMLDHRIEVVDIGLTLDQAASLGKEQETYARQSALPERLVPTLGDTERDAWQPDTRASKHHPVLMKRVELNALTSPELVTLIEQALTEHGATAKVVPDAATITAEGEISIRTRVGMRLDELLRELVDVGTIAMTLGSEIAHEAEPLTPEEVRAVIEPARPINWHAPIGNWAAIAVHQADDRIVRALREALDHIDPTTGRPGK